MGQSEALSALLHCQQHECHGSPGCQLESTPPHARVRIGGRDVNKGGGTNALDPAGNHSSLSTPIPPFCRCSTTIGRSPAASTVVKVTTRGVAAPAGKQGADSKVVG